MPRRLPSRRTLRRTALLTALTLTSATAANAAEHITLRNGFELDCLRHETLDPGHIRLYTTGGYQDLAASEIVRIETIPDPPPAITATQTTAPTAAEMRQLLFTAGSAHNIDEDLLASVIKAESGGHIHAVSRTGARGLMQLMPGTAAQLGVTDAFQPGQNINGGTAYLDTLLRRYKDNLALALAAYNAGPAAVDRYHGIPPFRETRAYVARVIREFNRRKSASRTTALAVASVPVR